MRGELTGRTSYRVQKHFMKEPVLVLQVEYKTVHHSNGGGQVESHEGLGWRDATVHDLVLLQEQKS